MTVYLAFNEGEATSGTEFKEASTYNVAESGVNRAGFTTRTNTGQLTADATLSSAIQEGFVHFDAYLSDAGSSTTAVALKDSSGGTVLEIIPYSNADVGVQTANGVGDTSITNGDELHTYDIHFRISDGTDGFFTVYVDQVIVYEESGVTQATTGVNDVETLTFSNKDNVFDNENNEKNHFAQVLVSNNSTLGAKVYTLDPDTAGSTNDWPSGTIADVDETGVDDTDFIATDTDNDQFTYDTSISLSALTGVNSYTALVQSFRASYDSGSSVTKITPFLNDTTATSTSFDTTQTLTTGFAPYQAIWENDPADASAWDNTKINNYEFGIQADT